MSFTLWFMGGEQQVFQKLLLDQEATNIGVSFWGLKRRLPKTKPYLFSERLDDAFSIFLDSGGGSLAKASLTVSEIEDYNEVYQDFVAANADRLTMVTELDAMQLGPRWIREQRAFYEEVLPAEVFMPIWHPDESTAELDRLAAEYERVGIHESALEQGNLAAKVNGMTQKYGTHFHALASAKPDDLRAVHFASAATSSWLSPMKYGETMVWDGTKLHRYPAKYKEQARKRHRMLFEREGFDADAILADDPDEVARLTVWSLLQMAEQVERRRPSTPLTLVQGAKGADDAQIVVMRPDQADDPFAEVRQGDVDSTEVDTRKSERVPAVPREPHERRSLPVLGFTQPQPAEDDTEPSAPPTMRLGGSTARVCDSCYVSSQCPAFKPGNECAFDLPVELRTQEQLTSALTTVLEMQVQRVAFARYTEELGGGYPDPNVSTEITRTFDLVERLKKIEDSGDLLRIEMRGRPASSGILSHIFGPKAGERELERPLNPAETNRAIAQVLDGEIVEDNDR